MCFHQYPVILLWESPVLSLSSSLMIVLSLVISIKSISARVKIVNDSNGYLPYPAVLPSDRLNFLLRTAISSQSDCGI